MGTSAVVGFKCGDDYIASIVHYDGYLIGAGLSLLDEYNTEDRAFDVAANGYLDSVPDTFEAFPNARRTNDFEAEVLPSEYHMMEMMRNSGGQFMYLFEDGKWYYWNTRKTENKFELTHKGMVSNLRYARRYFEDRLNEQNWGEDSKREFQDCYDYYNELIEKYN